MNLENIDDELAEYGFGAIAVIALAALIYTESVPVPEAWQILIAVIATLAGVGAGKHRQKKKTNAPDVGDLVDTLLSAMGGFDMSEEKARVSKTSESDPRPSPSAEGESIPDSVDPDATPADSSQTGTPASHDAAEAEKTQPATESTPLTDVQGIGPKRKARFTGTTIQTAEDLAAADADSVAMSTGLSTTRARTLIQRARELTRDE